VRHCEKLLLETPEGRIPHLARAGTRHVELVGQKPDDTLDRRSRGREVNVLEGGQDAA
jgi:hypothetical protein